MQYEWVNKKTGEVVTVERKIADYKVPPDDSGDWERIFTFAVGRVEGAGGSPNRASARRKKK